MAQVIKQATQRQPHLFGVVLGGGMYIHPTVIVLLDFKSS